MTERRDFRYVSQKFFDRWNDRIVKGRVKDAEKADRRYATLKGRILQLELAIGLRDPPDADK